MTGSLEREQAKESRLLVPPKGPWFTRAVGPRGAVRPLGPTLCRVKKKVTPSELAIDRENEVLARLHLWFPGFTKK